MAKKFTLDKRRYGSGKTRHYSFWNDDQDIPKPKKRKGKAKKKK